MSAVLSTSTVARRFAVVVRAMSVLGIGFLTACGGNANTGLPASQLTRTAQTARVTFTMHWTSASSAARRTPKYVPVTAQSVSVSVNGGLLQYLNSPSTTLTIDAPVGTDQFAFATYDDAAGQGNVLSRAAVTKAIVDGTANVVSAVLEGVPASLAISLGTASPNAGTAATIPILVSAKDADGNTIIGSSDYTVPIALTINDPAGSGTLSLSKSSLSSPAATANLVYSGGTLTSASVSAGGAGLSAVSATLTPTPTFYKFPLPGAASAFGIVAGADGNMWFTDGFNNKIGRITATGAVTEFAVPTANSDAEAITLGSDGRVWFTEQSVAKIGAITVSGQITEYSATSGCAPEVIGARFADGSIWYGCDSGTVNAVALDGTPLGSATVGSNPFSLAVGPDNYMYVANFSSATVSYLISTSSTVGTISTGSGSSPAGIVAGPDGNMWFTDRSLSRIGKISTTAHTVLATYTTLSPNASPDGITVGADGALWYTELANGRIGRITTAGVQTEYVSPFVAPNTALAFNIATAKDGSLWIAPDEQAFLEKFVY